MGSLILEPLIQLTSEFLPLVTLKFGPIFLRSFILPVNPHINSVPFISITMMIFLLLSLCKANEKGLILTLTHPQLTSRIFEPDDRIILSRNCHINIRDFDSFKMNQNHSGDGPGGIHAEWNC